MQKYTKIRVYGTAKGEAKNKKFSGQVVSIHKTLDDNIEFYFNKDKFLINKKQCEPVQFLFPSFVYLTESVSLVDNTKDEIITRKVDAANCYARRGSHWVKYVLSYNNLSAQPTNDEDSDFSDELGQEIGDLVINEELIKYNLHKAGFDDKNITKFIKIVKNSQ